MLSYNIFNFHIHDTDVNSDKHLPLGQGSIDWTKFFKMIKDMKPNFPITIEIAPYLEKEKINSLNISKALDKLYKPFLEFMNN